jgi:hypothetical protein
MASALGSSPVGKYWDSSDRNSQLQKMELLLNHKIAIARLSKTIGNRLLLSLFVLETLRDRLDVHSKLNKAIVVNRIDKPSGYKKIGNSFDKNIDIALNLIKFLLSF